jgi:prefoldin alpha subunit
MTDKENFQQKYFEYNMYKGQLEGLVKELEMLAAAEVNLQTAKETLDNVNKLEKANDILVPIGGNSFIKAEVKDTKNVLIGVGGDIVMKKPISDAKTTIDDQLNNLADAKQKMESQLKGLDKRMDEMEPELEDLALKMRKPPKKG